MRSRARSRSTSSIVIAAMADAIQKAARQRYGQETNIRADINPNTGEMKLQRLMEVVETVEDYATQIALETARQRNPDAEVGDFIAEQLPPLDFGRIAAQSAKQVIVQKVREAERDRQYDEYKDRIGEIVNGTVKRVEYGNVIVDLGRGEAIIRRDELIPRENYKYGDRVRAYVYDVRREQRGPQIFLSRTHPQFMAKLFTMEVPEIYDGIVEIKSVARDPGSRAKIAVISATNRSTRSAPASACAAARAGGGRRIAGREDRHHSVVAEQRRRRSSSTRCSRRKCRRSCSTRMPSASRSWFADEPALARHRPPRPERPPRLAAHRLGHRHPHRGRESQRRQKEFVGALADLFMDALNVDEMVGQLLATGRIHVGRGSRLCRSVEIAHIEGFDEDTASEIQTRAREYLARIEAERDARASSLASPTTLRDRGRDHRDDGRARRGRREVARGFRRLRDVDDLVGWTERKDGETPRP
jgi:N utilization substance protein A